MLLAAALLTLIVPALLRSYYSSTAFVMFILVWSSWLIADRLAFKYFTPPVRVLIIGTPNLATELRSLEGLQLTTTTTPPGTFDSWDIALIDSTRV